MSANGTRLGFEVCLSYVCCIFVLLTKPFITTRTTAADDVTNTGDEGLQGQATSTNGDDVHHQHEERRGGLLHQTVTTFTTDTRSDEVGVSSPWYSFTSCLSTLTNITSAFTPGGPTPSSSDNDSGDRSRTKLLASILPFYLLTSLSSTTIPTSLRHPVASSQLPRPPCRLVSVPRHPPSHLSCHV